MSDTAGGPASVAGSRWSIIVLVLGFALLFAVAAASAWLVSDQRAQNEQVAHTFEVQSQASRLLTALIDAETGQRGYLLTGGDAYFARHAIGVSEAPRAFARLLALTADNPRQQAALAAIRRPMAAKLAELRQTSGLYRAGRGEEALAIVRTNVGKRLMDALRVDLAAIQTEEAQLLRERRAAVESTANLLLAMSIGALAIAALLAAAAITSMLRYARGLEGANESVRVLNEGLEEKVAERTADLQAANDEIQRFAYIVSHDLRSPLVNVMGFTSELEAAGGHARALLDKVEAEAPALPDKDQQLAIREDLPEALGFIRTSTAKMDRLINAILRLSREGRRTLAPERIDMTKMLGEIAAGLHQQAEAAGATVEIGPLPEIVSDRLALDQVFGNLVENAIKYLQPGRAGRVTVTGRAMGPLVEITVEDNGRGIDKADQERVFDLFRRAGTQDQPGEGIGLAHVRALARRLGGAIALDSELGRGSRFTVTLPRQLKENTGE